MTAKNRNPTPYLSTPTSKSLSLFIVLVIGAFFLLFCGVLAFFADFLAGWPVLRPWFQISLFYTGVILLLAAARTPTAKPSTRILLAISGMIVLLTAGDSLDGRQHFLPDVAMALLLWALIYVHTTMQIFQANQPSGIRRWMAILLGMLATAVYFGVAIYYVIINWNNASVHVFQHPLFLYGSLILIALQWMGKLPYHN